MPSARKKCICQMCTCGRHMCPHRKKDHIDLGNNQQSAKSSSIATREEKRRLRKQWEVRNEKQGVSLSTDQLNANALLANAEDLATAVTVVDTGNSNQVSSSNAASNWSAKQIPKTLPIKRPDNLRAEGAADFRTTHQQDFNEKSIDSHIVDSASASSEMVQADSWNKKQIPRTQKIIKPDNLMFSGTQESETTHQAAYSESKFTSRTEQSEQSDKYQRPRTSLKLGGEFQSDSSYQKEFTPKQANEGYKVKKGTSKSHLKPEGKMTFETTSLDYNAVSTHVSRASEHTEELTVLKPKKARPESEIKIPSVPISDETTLVSDFKRWDVEKPTKHKPKDTLTLGDSEDADLNVTFTKGKSSYRSDTSVMETSMSDYKNWQVTRPVVHKPENNLKPEGSFNFATTTDIDYSSRRDMTSKRVLEPLTERTETESIAASGQEEHTSVLPATEVDKGAADDGSVAKASVAEVHSEVSALQVEPPVVSNGQQEAQEQKTIDSSLQIEQKAYGDNDVISQSEDQTQYVSWDQIRPKPIRPHSNLRQEGGMEFNTTNRSEFVSRSMERVKGIRPKTNTKMFEGDFDATTMNQVMFSNEQGEKATPIRPKGNLHVESGNFADETTTAREFQPWEIHRPPPIIPRSNLTQEGTMEFTTTNHTEFDEKILDKVHPIRPTETNQISGDIDLTTTNRVMHAEFPIERVKKIVPQSNLRMSSGVFEAETTNKSQFQEWDIDRPKPIKPVSNLTQEGSMDFTTMNKLQFEEKPMERVQQFRPHTSSKITGDFDGTTTNQVMFAAQAIDRPHMIMPKGNIQLEKGTFASDTTNHSEFQQWQQSKSEAVTPRNNLHQEGSVDFTTTNQTQFGVKAIDRVSEIRPKTNPKMTGEFDGTTTNQVMFQDSPRKKLDSIKPQNNLQLERGNFTNETTNRKEYQQWEYSKPSLTKPHSSIRQEGDIEFSTTNEREYAKKTAEKVSPMRPVTTSKMTGEFDGTTTNQVMFQDSPREKLQAVKPQNNLQLEKGTFTGETTNKTEFQQWEYSKPSLIKPHGSMKQEGDIDFSTTNERDFAKKTIDKVSPIKPVTATKITGEFQGTTTNQAMFQSKSVEKVVKGKRPPTNIHLEKGKFEDQTTARREFQQWEINRPVAIKPTGNLAQEGDMDFTTSNSVEFEAKQITTVEPIRPHTSSPVTGEFDGTTTNQVMFQGQTADKVRDIRPKDNLRVDSGLFGGETTSSKEFAYKTGIKPEAIKPRSNLTQEGEFDFTTSNQMQFEQKKISKVAQIRPKTLTKASDGTFYSTTTNQAMYQTPPMESSVHGIKPSDNLQVEKGTFQSTTTSSDEYQQWKVQKPTAYQLASNLKQEGDMNFETTNTVEFKERSFDRVQQIRPKTTNRIEGDFEGTTTNQAMFQQHGSIQRAKPIRHENNLHVEGGKFANETTNSREFRQWVKMESKDSQSKRKSQAAGVRTQKEKVEEKKESGVRNNGGGGEKNQYEAWKLSKESREASVKESTVVNGHSPSLIVDDKTKTQNQSERLIRKGESAQNVQSKVHGETSDACLQKQEISTRSSQTVLRNEEKQQTTRDISTVTTDYGTKQATKVKAIIPAGNLSSQGDMTFVTTSGTDYSRQSVSKMQSDSKQISGGFRQVSESRSRKSAENVKGIISAGNLSNGDMNFATTSQTDFSPKRISKHKSESMLANGGRKEASLIQSMKSSESKGGLDLGTSRREESRGSPSKGQDSRDSSLSPQKTPTKKKNFRPDDNLKLEPVPFDGTSTTRAEFKKWEARRSSSKRRTESLKQEGQMEFDTTSNDYSTRAYQSNRDNIKAKSKADQKGSLGQTGSMEFTTSNSSYTGNYGMKSKMLRPRSSFKFGSEAVANNDSMSSTRSNPETSTHDYQDLVSTSRASYVTHTTSRRSVANRPSTSQKVGGGSFEGQTTARSSFKAQQGHVEKPRAIKPESHNILNVENGFSGGTTYRNSFETVKTHHCPVLDLQADRSPFSFNEEKNGHLFYVPRVKG